MKKILLSIVLIIIVVNISNAQEGLNAFPVTEGWKAKVYDLAPQKATAKAKKTRKILLFSLFTGFNHWTVPHTAEMVKILGTKSGAFEIVESNDIAIFDKANLKSFDAIVLNNTCSKPDHRDIFFDVLNEDKSLTESEIKTKAAEYEKNLLEYVKTGGGLIVLHGGIVMQNKSAAFGDMMGGSFDYHPVQQKISVKLVDNKHPLVAAFEGEGFDHIDEPYFFNNAYFDYNFKPLLYMETDKLHSMKTTPSDKIKYIAWIKKYGKGRVFYASPSHNAQVMDNPKILKFFLDGMQYAIGDLKCDDKPMRKSN